MEQSARDGEAIGCTEPKCVRGVYVWGAHETNSWPCQWMSPKIVLHPFFEPGPNVDAAYAAWLCCPSASDSRQWLPHEALMMDMKRDNRNGSTRTEPT